MNNENNELQLRIRIASKLSCLQNNVLWKGAFEYLIQTESGRLRVKIVDC